MDYEINSNTLAIIPFDRNSSKVIEKDNEYIMHNSPYNIMEHSCEYFGSSILGRLSGSKNILGSVYKAPILVEESRSIIFFPIKSPTVSDNCWISLNGVLSFEQYENGTKINFKNGKFLIVDVNYLSFENQILRSTRLESVLRQRKLEKND